MKAISSKTTLPILTGIKLEVTEEGLYLTGSDSDITIQTFINAEESGEQVIRVIEEGMIVVQARMFNEIVRNLPTNDVEIEVNELHTHIRSGKSEFHINGQDASDVILDGKALFQAIDRASLMAREERNNIVQFTSLDGTAVEVSSSSPELGKVEEEIPATSIEGEELKISFSAKYMMDALKAIGGHDVKVQFTGAMRPFILNSVHNDSVLQLIVPVRTY